MNKNKKINFARKTITALLIISMLFGLLQTSAFVAADESLKIQVGDTAVTWENAITEANSKGSAVIEIISDITITSTIDITSDITIISAEGDYTITVLPSGSITIQGGALTVGDGLATNFLTISSTSTAIYVKSGTVHIKDGSTISAIGDNCKTISVDNGDVNISGGTVSANGEECKVIYVNNGNVAVYGGTVTATGDYCSAIEVITGNVAVSGGTVLANADNGHICYAICLGISGGTVKITGGTVSATGSLFNDNFAISLKKNGLATYLKGTCDGTFEVWGTGIIVEVELLDIPRSYEGTNNGLTRKAGSAISTVKWDVSGDIVAISFNNKQYTIEWTMYNSICEIIDGKTLVGAYSNFADALAAVQDGQTIRLLSNIEYNTGIVITGKSITIDLNGFTLNVTNSSGHGLEVGAGGELWLIGRDTGGKFNVKGNGTNKQGVYAHSGGKAEVSTAYAMMNWGDIERGAYATGAGTVITVYGNVNSDTFYAIEAADGATLTVYGNTLAGAGMIARGVGTTVTVYGNSGGGGTGVFAYDGARVFVGGNVIGGGAGVYVSTGAQVTINGTVKATSGDKVYVQFSLGGGKYDNKMQGDHELTSSKAGYFEYKSGDSIVWVKDPVIYVVRHRETGNLYKTISEAITAIKPRYDTFVLEVFGDVLEKDHIIIDREDVTIVSVDGSHTVTFASPVPSSGWKFALQGGGTLTLGEGNTENTLTILHSVDVTKGHIIAKDGIIIKSGSDALRLSGPNAVGTISGGRFEGNGTLNIIGTGLSLENGAKIIEISGGVFMGNIDAVHVSGAGTRINKISGGAFYQTDPNTTLHGHAIFVQNAAEIGEISGGHFEAIRNRALVIIRGGWVDEISGGEFVVHRVGTIANNDRNAAIWIQNGYESDGYARTGIGTISGGNILGTDFGLLLIAEYGESYVGKITGGTIKGTVALQNDRGGVITEISGGDITGSQGILNVGTIGKISGNVKITGTGSYGIYNYYTNNQLFGKINEISGGTIIADGRSAQYGIMNSGTITLISGGTIIGRLTAINCDGTNKGRLETITNGVFWGKNNAAINLAYTLNLEPGLSTNMGLGRYQSGNGLVFNNEKLVIYPAGYYMSSKTTPVSGITDVEFKYLTRGDEYNIEYVLNGGVNDNKNPTTYDKTTLPCTINNPTMNGYNFQGWIIQNSTGIYGPITNYVIPIGSTGDFTLTATWQRYTDQVSYKVNYYLQNSKTPLAPSKIVYYQTMGTTVTETAINIIGYTALEPTTITITIDDIDNEITFYYTPNTNIQYTVHYYLQNTKTPLAPSKIVYYQTMGTTVTETAINIIGYTALEPTTITITLNGINSIITFYYTGMELTPNPSVNPSPLPSSSPSVNPSPLPSPSTISGGETEDGLPAWALVNLILSVAGVILAIILTIDMLLQHNKKQKKQQEQKQTKDAKGQYVEKQKNEEYTDNVVEEKKQKQRWHFWFLLSVIMGIVGIIVFILTEDLTRPMTIIDKWTVVNTIIFIIELIAIAFTLKHKNNKAETVAYTVHYYLQGTKNPVASSKTSKFGTVGLNIIEHAPNIAGYTIVGDAMTSLALNKDTTTNTIVFYYTLNAKENKK